MNSFMDHLGRRLGPGRVLVAGLALVAAAFTAVTMVAPESTFLMTVVTFVITGAFGATVGYLIPRRQPAKTRWFALGAGIAVVAAPVIFTLVATVVVRLPAGPGSMTVSGFITVFVLALICTSWPAAVGMLLGLLTGQLSRRRATIGERRER